MPSELELYRKAQQEFALRAAGLLPKTQTGMTANVVSQQHEAEILALPFDSRLYAPLQDADGNFFYMVDYDPVDGAPIS